MMRPTLRRGMRHAGWTSLKDGAERSLKIALGLLVLLVALIHVAGPRSAFVAARIAEEEAASLAAANPAPAAPSPQSAGAAASPPSPPDASAPPASSQSAIAGRNVTPPSITAPILPTDAASLTRVAPREPLSAAEAARQEADGDGDGDRRLRLLFRPVAIDTGTFLVQRAKVRLAGVQPVAPSRECGEGDAAWPCGMKARTALRLWLRARSIRCDVPENFGKAEATLDAECSLGPNDIGQWLVENGWAEARPDGRYTAIEAKARDAGRGIWGLGRGAPADTQ